jgi:hypothetical protein
MLFLSKHNIIDLYCFVDDLLEKEDVKSTGRPRLMNDSEIITAIVWNTIVSKCSTIRDLHDHLSVYHRDDFPKLPKYNAFLNRCHILAPKCLEFLQSILTDEASVRIMDSTMLPVCKLQRADDHKVAKSIARFGKNWQGWHYGFKLHTSIDLSGKISGMALTPANIYDAQAMTKILNENCKVAVGDTLYGAKVMGRIVWEKYGTVIIAPPHPKQKRKVAVPWQIDLLNMRSKIESVFDYLKNHLHLVTSFARSMKGYLVHYIRILLSYQIMALSQG